MAKKEASAEGDDGVFTEEERAAMREMVKERKAQAAGKTDGETDVLEKIASMEDHDREISERLHALIMTVAPELEPRTWYGSPAYSKDGKVLLFYQETTKFKTRYMTLGFSDQAQLDEGDLWPISYAVQELTPEVEERIAGLVKRAVGEE